MPPFLPGTSGNPKGRPKGTANPSTKLRRAIADDLPAIIDVLRQHALDGDVAAARLLLERALPALRPETAAVSMPVAGKRLDERAEAVVTAALAGDISATAAAELMGLLAANAKVIEAGELEGRIAALEGKHGID